MPVGEVRGGGDREPQVRGGGGGDDSHTEPDQSPGLPQVGTARRSRTRRGSHRSTRRRVVLVPYGSREDTASVPARPALLVCDPCGTREGAHPCALRGATLPLADGVRGGDERL